VRLFGWLRRRRDDTTYKQYAITVKLSGLSEGRPWNWTDEEWARGWKPEANDAPRWREEPAEWTVSTGEGDLGFESVEDATEYVRLSRLGGWSVDDPTFKPYERWDLRPFFRCKNQGDPSFITMLDDALKAAYAEPLAEQIFKTRSILDGLSDG